VTQIRTSANILCLLLLLSATSAPQDKDAGSRGARKACDALMADLVTNRLDDAMEKLAPKAKPRSEGFRKMESQMFDQCGRPLDSTIQNHGKPFLGEDVLPEGTKINWTFQYRCKTTRQPSEFWVTAEMVEDGHYKLAFTCNPDPRSMPARPE
jgi:hypothetical protein